jgi:hypothetical protein
MKYIWIGVSLVAIVVIVYFITSKKSSQVDQPKETKNPMVIVEPTSTPSQSLSPTSTPVPTTAAPVPTTAAPVPTPSQTPFFATTAPKTTVAPTSSPSPTTVAPTSPPSPTTVVQATAAPTAAPLNWTPYGATIFTSPTESSFQVGACDANGVQYRQTTSGSPTLTDYMICANNSAPTFAGKWDTCIIRGINYGPVTIADGYGGANPTITAGSTVGSIPFPANWSTPTLVLNDVKNVQNSKIRAVDNNGNYTINDYIGQVAIYYNKGERVAIRIGTKGSNCYLSRNLNKSNQGYETISGNVFNNVTRSYDDSKVNVVSDGSILN